jgi:DNA (cytosine-5)-methyltransferase 1
MMSHIDLCSGIGGFALGFQWAGLSKPVLFCDIEPWSRQILKKHWPHVPIAEDVKELANDPNELIPNTDPQQTILTAGYPCQPFSVAGNQKGAEDDRHIWPYIREIVAHKRPAWCVFENVYGHVSLGLNQVLFDLESEDYTSRTFVVPACGVDAPHRRDRLWIVANADRAGQRQSNQEMARGPSEQSDSGSVQPGQAMADPSGSKRQGCCKGQVYGQSDIQEQSGRGSQGEPAQRSTFSGLGGMADGIPRWLDEPSDIPRTVTGVKGRAARLKGLGNAIVPQIAMKIGETIKACEVNNGVNDKQN